MSSIAGQICPAVKDVNNIFGVCLGPLGELVLAAGSAVMVNQSLEADSEARRRISFALALRRDAPPGFSFFWQCLMRVAKILL